MSYTWLGNLYGYRRYVISEALEPGLDLLDSTALDESHQDYASGTQNCHFECGHCSLLRLVVDRLV